MDFRPSALQSIPSIFCSDMVIWFVCSDVLRKHFQGCSGSIAQDLETPECLAVRKKATACDQCAYSKKACNRKNPCSTCVARENTCTFKRQMSSSKLPAQKPNPSLEDKDDCSDFNYDFLDDMDLAANFTFADPAEWSHWTGTGIYKLDRIC